jgi:hypothetical protein
MGLRNILMGICLSPLICAAQGSAPVRLVKIKNEKQVDVYIGGNLFTRFLYPDSLEKPVLFPIYDAGRSQITRGFPREPRAGEPTDHPHHLGCWLSYENVNGLDFWNNSYAIPAEKKSLYGWIKTDSILEISEGTQGNLHYHANWVNQQNQVLLEETTRFVFSGNDQERIIDRITDLSADTDILFADAKDGMFGLRLTHELQIPEKSNQSFTDNKGNVTEVKKDLLANGNYLTSEGKTGDSAWGTRGNWCKVFGKLGHDSVSIIIFDHQNNPNYPTFWHARGYGLFAANPLGEKIFTNGKSSFNLRLKKGYKVRFCYRLLIQNGNHTQTVDEINEMAQRFNSMY